MTKSIFTISVWNTRTGTGCAPEWQIMWEGEDFPSMMMELGSTKSRWQRVRLDWRDEEINNEA